MRGEFDGCVLSDTREYKNHGEKSEVITCWHTENTELSMCKFRDVAACTEHHKRNQHARCQMAQLFAFISAKHAARITMPAISHNSTVNMKTMGRRAKSLPAGMHKIQSSAGVNSGTWPHVQNIINTTSMYGLCVLTGAGGQS
jgi:hypothetical protein